MKHQMNESAVPMQKMPGAIKTSMPAMPAVPVPKAMASMKLPRSIKNMVPARSAIGKGC